MTQQAVQTEDKTVFITKEGLEKLNQELDYLKNVRRREIAVRIKEAISYGDLSENAEWEEAKNEQAFVEGRILELEAKIKDVKIISDHHTQGALVQVGSKVVLKNMREKKEEEYTIVGSMEADPFEGKISNESPIGRALLDHGVGDTVKVLAPAGAVEYQIAKVL